MVQVMVLGDRAIHEQLAEHSAAAVFEANNRCSETMQS